MLRARSLALSGGLATACAAPAIGQPLENWMIGSDVGSPEVVLTHELRDVLEARVASRKLKTPRTGEHVYLPEFVSIQDERFEYRAILTHDNQNAVRLSVGTCQRTALSACADHILSDLGQN
jgi:hypothetical protein